VAHRSAEAIKAVETIVTLAGASVTFGKTGGQHQVADLQFGGVRRKYFFAATGNSNAHMMAAYGARKLLRKMGAAI
jgi:hypothetical protein